MKSNTSCNLSLPFLGSKTYLPSMSALFTASAYQMLSCSLLHNQHLELRKCYLSPEVIFIQWCGRKLFLDRHWIAMLISYLHSFIICSGKIGVQGRHKVFRGCAFDFFIPSFFPKFLGAGSDSYVDFALWQGQMGVNRFGRAWSAISLPLQLLCAFIHWSSS